MDKGDIYLVDPANVTSVYSDDASFNQDTTLGLQVESELSEKLKGTAQLVVRGSMDFNVAVDWAYLTYDITNDISVSVGRKRIPAFLYSESLDIGYTYHWIRPPYEVYNIPQVSYNGISSLYKKSFGAWSTEAQVFFGREDVEDAYISSLLGDRVTTSTKNLLGFNCALNRRWLQVRLVVAHDKLDAVGQTIGPVMTDVDVKYYGVSVGADFGSLFFIGEASLLDFDKDINTNFTWFVSGGARFGKFTPHITYSVGDEDDNNLPGMKVKQNTTTAGIRYDFHPNADLKLEYSIRKDESEGTTFFGDADLISFAMDYFF